MFHDKGKWATCPIDRLRLAAWIAGIIRNPAEKRFYGKLNDRMPAYAAAADPAQNALNPVQIKMLTNWLRGEWYQEPPAGEQ